MWTGDGIVPLFLDAFEIIDDFDFDILEVIDYFDLHVLEVLDQFDSAARVLEVPTILTLMSSKFSTIFTFP